MGDSRKNKLRATGDKKTVAAKKKTASRRGTIVSGAPAPRRGLRKWAYRGFVGLVWGVILMVPLVIYYAYDLPDLSDLTRGDDRATVILLDRNGGTLATYGAIHGAWVPYDAIPPVLIQAVLATEDRRFYDHSGLDLRGLARAMVTNIRRGELVEGGSTISQQLAKNLFLNAERTIKRKVQELFLSYWLELKFSKSEILELYLNRVYFGTGAYGIDAAARTFYGHGARDLSLVEAAMLAGVLKGPALYSPLRDLERAYKRTAVVLDNMVETGVIPPAVAAETKGRSVTLVESQTGGDERYFSDWIVERAAELVGPVAEPIRIHTTLMPDMQARAAKAMRQILNREGERYHIEQGALVSLDPDGAVRAMVGGRDYGRSKFNRATQARRQPGSAFKLFIYLTALEQGLTPEDVMRDSPVILDGWEPQNYDGEYRGIVTLREAFIHSLNTVAVKLMERLNRQDVIAMARRLGITTPLRPLPSLALGAAEVSLLELTAAYGVVANGGFRVTPYGIVEIQNSHGQILYRHMPGPPERLLADSVVAGMDDMLRGAIAEGTARRAQMTFPVAGKTGTTQDYKDALFMGYGRGMVNGVWVGNDDATPMRRVTGGGTPARIWRNFMYRVDLGRDDATLATPDVRPREKPARVGE